MRKRSNFSDIFQRLLDVRSELRFSFEFFRFACAEDFMGIQRLRHADHQALMACALRAVRFSRVFLFIYYLVYRNKLSPVVAVTVWLALRYRGGAVSRLDCLDVASGVLLHSFRALKEVAASKDKVVDLYDSLHSKFKVSDFGVEDFKFYQRLLVWLRKYSEVLSLHECRCVSEIPDHTYYKNLVVSNLYYGNYDCIRRVKDEIKDLVEEKAYIDFLLSIKPAALDGNDLEVLFAGLGRVVVLPGEIYAVSKLLYSKGYDFKSLSDLAAFDGLTEYQRYKVKEMALECDQERLLRLSEINPASMEQFRSFANSLDKIFRNEFQGVKGDASALCNVTMRLEERFGNSLMLVDSSFYHAWLLATRLRSRIREGVPTSFVRIGDGEALFLPDLTVDQSCVDEVSRDRIIETWWGKEFSKDSAVYEQLAEIIEEAVLSADFLGMAPKWRIFDDESYNHDSLQAQRKAFLSAAVYVESLGGCYFSDKTLTSCHAHRALIRWDLYAEVLRDVDSVSVVSCHDLSGPLMHEFGVKVRCHHSTPAEAAYAYRFGAKQTGEKMYPDCLRRIMAELEVLPGEVFLVAAGFVGKKICTEIKLRGGIALDIGSAADFFMGHETRVFESRKICFEPRPGLFSDLSIDPVAISKSARVDVSGFVVTDNRRRRNIMGLSKSVVGPVSRAGNVVMLIGHPRCASGYVSTYLSGRGLVVGHEEFARDGVCSWMHAVNDLNVPWGDAPSVQRGIKFVVAFARDPLAAVPSIVMENTDPKSFSFRRYHICDLEGVDIARFESALERAVASYTYWYRIVLRHDLVGIIRAEFLSEDADSVISKLKSNGVAIELGVGDGQELLRRNDSDHKFDFAKPVFDADDWRRVDKNLLAEFVDVSSRLGYQLEIGF